MLLEAPAPRKQLISMTPLIDVVFILLLFFMLSSTFVKTRQLEIKAAGASSSQLQSQVQKILLHVGSTVTIDGMSYALQSDEFERILNRFASDDDKVTVAAMGPVKVQNIIRLIDQARQAGISKLKLSQSVSP